MESLSSLDDDSDLLTAIELSMAQAADNDKKRVKEIMNNPIYGYIGGAETCWFNSALQMLLNTQKYREWIKTYIPNPKKTDSAVIQKCFILHNALETIFREKEKYPFNQSEDANNRVINISDFIKFASNIIK